MTQAVLALGTPTGSTQVILTVVQPVITPASESVSTPPPVTITCATVGAQIYYTTDGTTPTFPPTGTSQHYTGTFTPTGASPLTINAVGGRVGFVTSSPASETYTITTPTVSAPAISPGSALVAAYPSVTMTDSTAGAAIYYTTDGTTPTYPVTGTTTLYSGPFTPSGASPLTVQALGQAAGYSNSSVASVTYTLQTVAPSISPATGTFTTAPSVTITDSTGGASIYYTTDGSTPTTSSTLYAGPFTPVGASPLTVKAIAQAPGTVASVVASATYTITSPVATPSISPGTGAFATTPSVTITDSTAGSAIYYTTDGTTPTTSSTLYTGPFTPSGSSPITVQAISTKAGYTQSAVASVTYTINGQVATPAVLPVTGSYSSVPSVSITCATGGASIFYTTDGTTPTIASTPYTGAFTPPGTPPVTITVKALATHALYTNSAIGSSVYTVSSGPTLTITSPLTGAIFTSGTQGSAYGPVTITAANGVLPYSWSGTGMDGCTIEPSGTYTAVFSGTPSGSGSYNPAITVRDSTGATYTAIYNWSVAASGGGSTLPLYANGVFKNMWTVGIGPHDLSYGTIVTNYGGNQNTPDTESVQIGNSSGFQYASDWSPYAQGGSNGYDTSQYTWLQFDISNPGGGTPQLGGVYMRGDAQLGYDLSISTGIGVLSNVPGIASYGTGWTKGLRVPRCFLGQLGEYNHYKEHEQIVTGPLQVDNVQYIGGNLAWIYRGNPTLEAGWNDSASSGVSANYIYLPQTLNGGNVTGSLFAINAPPRAACNFTGSINASNVLTVATVNSGGTIRPSSSTYAGDHLYFGPNQASGVPKLCFIASQLTGTTGGAGTYTLTGGNGAWPSQLMMSVQDQQYVPAALLTTSAGAEWKVTYSGGFSTAPYSYLTFGVIPTKAGGSNTYTVTAYSTTGAVLGSVSITPGSLTYTCSDFGHNTTNFTVYMIPLSALGVSSTVGAFGIKDANGVNPLLSAVALFS